MNTHFLSWLGLSLAFSIAGCASPHDSVTTSTSSALESDGTSPVHGQYVLYYSARAVREVVLQAGGRYYLIDSIDVSSGTWAFDETTNKVTLTPDAGQPGALTLEGAVVGLDLAQGAASVGVA